MKFDELQLAPAITRAVHEQGYETPTPIQAQAIPLILQGDDVLGGAQTGTGKTAAFVLPMLHRLAAQPRVRNSAGGIGIRALVLTPTRELAAQVEESVRIYGQYTGLSSCVIFGGVGMNPQIAQLKKGVDILVATPGRLLDLREQGMLDLTLVQVLVLDEADRMLDMGFIHDVRKVLAALPREKQSLLFSATFSDEIRDLAAGLLKNPKSIQVTPPNSTVQLISQSIHPVGRNKKKALLAHIISEHNWSQVLVFTRTKFGANHVADYLVKNGISAMALHGNKSQTARTQALAGFKSGDIRALVATDIAARGLDIDDLPHVVNYEIPNISEDYVHRIGRTGRAGAQGEAVSLVCLDEEGFMQAIERFTRQEIPVKIYPEFMPEAGEVAEPIAMGRQTLWGGAGKPPSREVMAAAARTARSEMQARIRESRGAAKRPDGQRTRSGEASSENHHAQRARNHRRQNSAGNQGDDFRSDDTQPRSHLSAAEQAVRKPSQHHRGRTGGGYPIGASTQRSARSEGQPDPMRTSVDMMSEPRRQGHGMNAGNNPRSGNRKRFGKSPRGSGGAGF